VNLVLLHPLPLDASIWPHELSGFAPNLYRLGESIEEWASAVLDLAPPGPLVLVGNSVGGSCAIEVAVRAPERARLLVLIGTKAAHRPQPEYRDEIIDRLSTDGMDGAWPRYWEPLFAPEADPSSVERARSVAAAQPIEDIVRGVRVFHTRPDRASFLSDFDKPVVIVNGEHDHPDRGLAIATGLRRSTHRVVEGAGHYLPLERPNALIDIVAESVRVLDS
jgi:pimeloyl-ACP methyl ester carboxylesterase